MDSNEQEKTEPSVIAIPATSTLAEAEKYLIQATLARFNGNRSDTARALGICVRTLRYRLAQYRNEENG